MKNKKMLLKLSVIAMAICGLWISFSSATLFHLEVNTWTLSAAEIALMKSEIAKKIMPIHFADNWNDFGWFFYFSNGLTGTISAWMNPVTIDNDKTFNCDNQVRWYYYNAERWERLWPLDDDTKNTRKDLDASQWGLNINWWIYTVCTVTGYNEALTDCWTAIWNTWYEECINEVRAAFKADDNWYYWYVEHEYSWQKMALVAGIDYNTWNTKFVEIQSNSKFSPTFIRYLNQNPVWFIYDYNWWVGLVWCKFKIPLIDSVKKVIKQLYSWWHVDLKNIFYITWDKIEVDAAYSAYIDCSGSNAVWSPVLSLIIEWVIWLADEKKVWYVGTQKDEKMQYFSSANINNNTLINYAKKKAEVLCRWKWNKSSSNNIVCVDHSISVSSSDKGKTFIVKNWDVTINPEGACDISSFNSNWYYNITIINSWNLVINEGSSTSKCVFRKDGFLLNWNVNIFADAVTWAALGGWKYDLSSGAAVWSYIKWNFIVDWNIVWPSTADNKLENKYFVYWKLTTQDDFNTLLSTFSWRCNYWKATDDTYCPESLYQNAPLTVIDQNYPSPFYNS